VLNQLNQRLTPSMEPGTAAAAYTAETAIEGVVAGALAIAQSTVPLKVRFHRLNSPSPALKRFSHTLNVIKGRAYILGGDGDVVGGQGDDAMHVLTLPSDLDLRDSTDYQKIPAVGKSSKSIFNQKAKVEKKSSEAAESVEINENVPGPRAGHSACVIGDRIYVIGGSRPTGASDPTVPFTSPLEEEGRVYVFDTIGKTWEVIRPNEEACANDVPPPRNCASSSSTTHPLPIRNEDHSAKVKDEWMTEEAKLRLIGKQEGETLTATEEQSEGYGTLFLHGGYDSDGNLLRDFWAFDVGSRVWSRWSDIPDSDVEAGEGNICCIESRVWRCGDGFGKMAHFDIVRDQFNDMSGKGELGVSPKSGKWEVHTFGVKPGNEELEKQVEKKMGGKPTNIESLFPQRRKRAGFLPVTTGQGRDYVLLFMGEQEPREMMDDVWSFQIASEKKSAAAFKDTMRTMIGKQTGMEQWAKAEIVHSNGEDGVLDYPKGLSRFGSSPGGDYGGVVIWGGIGPGGDVSADGWILTLE
jgi:Kelch motif/Galactose oxidase, central domain